MIKRVELLVYFNYKASTVQTFKDLGAEVEYVNKKAGYAVLYLDEHKSHKFTDQLRHIKGVRKFEYSPIELVELDIN